MNNPLSQDEPLGLSLCQSLGRRAHKLRLDIIVNPYEHDSEKWHAFNKGWLEAMQESTTVLGTAA